MYCLNLPHDLSSLLDDLRNFLNSAFVSAFLSALAGAGLGVWGAQKVAARESRRKELQTALRQANALVVLAATIGNQALSVKKQHVADMMLMYFEDRALAEAHNDLLLRGGTPSAPLHVRAELVKLTPLTVPIEALKGLIYSAELMPGKALALVSMVEQSLTELSHAIGVRSEQIDRLKNTKMTEEIFLQTYFGLNRRDGNVDAMYHDAMVAIAQYLDDVAFFSTELAAEIHAHAERAIKKLEPMTREKLKATKADFSQARESGLLPPREYYKDWLAGFQSN